jgi:hypothetical protein
MWPALPVTDTGALAMAAAGQLRRPSQLAQCGPDGDWLAPDWPALDLGPVLLLLHDTFSTPQSTFADWVGDASFAEILRGYGGRCLAFAHPTLASGLEENVSWLWSQVAHLPGPFDIVALGRGGLLARAIAADRRLPLRRVCQVGRLTTARRSRSTRTCCAFSTDTWPCWRAFPPGWRTTLEGVFA